MAAQGRDEETAVAQAVARDDGQAAQSGHGREAQGGRRHRERRATEVRLSDIVRVTLHVALYLAIIVAVLYMVAFLTFLVAL